MPRHRPLAALMLAVSLSASASFAQDLPSLLSLSGDQAWVRYTPGSLDRAATVQGWLSALGSGISSWGGRKVTLGAFLLERREWEEQGLERPYGLPLATGNGQVALPAFGDEGTVALWRELGGSLPAVAELPVRGTAQEAGSVLAADRLGAMEVARSLVRPIGFRPSTGWLEDLLGHLMAQAAFAKVGGVAETLPARGGADLAGYREGMPFAEWLALQAELSEGARRILADEPRRTVPKLLKLQERSGGQLTPGVLAGRYEGFAAWLEAISAPPAAR